MAPAIYFQREEEVEAERAHSDERSRCPADSLGSAAETGRRFPERAAFALLRAPAADREQAASQRTARPGSATDSTAIHVQTVFMYLFIIYYTRIN